MLQAAITAATDAGSEEALAVAETYLFETLEWQGCYADALALAERVSKTGRRLRLAQLVVWAEWFQAKAVCCLGDYGRAITTLRQGIDLCDRIGDRAWKTRLLNTSGWVLAEIGAERDARAHNEAAARLGLEVGDSEIIANSHINLAWDQIRAGELDEAGAYLETIRTQLAGPTDPWMRWRWRR